MRVKLPLVLCHDQGDEETVTDIITLNKHHQRIEHLGLTLAESTHLLSTLQQPFLQQPVNTFLDTCSDGPDCGTPLHLKARSRRSFRTVFGTVQFDSPRLEQCDCTRRKTASCRPLSTLRTESVAPELLYMEAKWSSLARTFCRLIAPWTSKPCGMTRSRWPSGWKRSWGMNKRVVSKAMPVPGTSCHCLREPFRWALMEATCAMGWTRSATSRSLWVRGLSVGEGEEDETLWHKRCGFVQTYDDAKPKRRLHEVLHAQGLQMNQAMTFLSDGHDTLRVLQVAMSPKATPILDWLHLTMQLTVLGQYGKGLVQCEAELGQQICDQIERLKWSLWHRQVDKVLAKIHDLQTSVAQFIRACRWFKLVYM